MTRATERAGARAPSRRRALACVLAGLAACRPAADSAGDPVGEPGASERSAGFLPPPAGGREAELALALAAERERARELQAALEDARAQLAVQEEQRVEREREWLEYSALLAMLPAERLPGGKPFAAEAAREEPAPAPPEPGDPELASRSDEIARSLRALFALEEVRGLDLLECGVLDGSAIGPVVFRLLDGRGRLSGSLYAERLRLEGSRAARTLTLVLEAGYEASGGEKHPFAKAAPEDAGAGVRRIVIEGVDPAAWTSEFQELFGETGLDLSGDDGLWDLALVKLRLNALLEEQRAGGEYRLRELGGIQDGVFIGVHLERLDAERRVERRFFADRLRVARSGAGVELTLESGVQVRAEDERVPFLDGRYRILLPAADGDAWTRARIPGLALPPGPGDR